MNEKELFEKVYDVLFEHDPELIKATKKTDAMVAELMESIYEITEDESEAVSGCIFDIISEARRDGCIIGAKHAVKLIFSLLSN